MSGHSKWSKVKHQKAVNDVVKSSQFTKASRAITVAVTEGGGLTDPDMNFRLRLAIDKAREVNMPKDKIERAIERAKGVGGETYERILFEGYGPFGVALLIESMTDNRNRTVSAVKNVLERAGGSMASPGAVSFLFKKTGLIHFPKANLSYDQALDLALSIGAEDVTEFTDGYEFSSPSDKLSVVTSELVRQGIVVESSRLSMVSFVPLELNESQEAMIRKLVESLLELDDVQDVATNLL